jgi:SHS2 domain-containing protein
VSDSGSGFDYFEVEADVGVRAWGRDTAEAFGAAALGVLALAVGRDEIREVETREVRAQADTPETLLVSWINECLYVHEIEGFAVRRVEVDHLAGHMVHGILHGEAIDPSRHRLGTVVKAATMHQTAVAHAQGRVDVRVVVDV